MRYGFLGTCVVAFAIGVLFFGIVTAIGMHQRIAGSLEALQAAVPCEANPNLAVVSDNGRQFACAFGEWRYIGFNGNAE